MESDLVASADRRVLVADTVMGLLHPGEMGAAVAGCLTARGGQVRWLPDGRSAATAARAARAGLTAAGSLAELTGRAGMILSICPPHAALAVARAVAGVPGGFPGIFVDANAISPGTAGQVRAIVEQAGASYVDGGIIGLPPGGRPGSTRLYLSGPRSGAVRDLFTGTELDARVIDTGAGSVAASAVKMAYAGWTKGSAALLLAVRALARADGVEDTLLEEWALSQPELAGRSAAAARSAEAKGWRWTGEMTEIAASMAAAGLPDGFHQAAAEIFRRTRPGAADGTDEVLRLILDG
jgi:3-hydroxyisobutyrate dehydrogenase-like beta-hydroxyacid dehydrogenase